MRFALLTISSCALLLASCNRSASEQLAGRNHRQSSAGANANPNATENTDLDDEADGATEPVKSIQIGDRVPDFVVTINGEKKRLSELQSSDKLTRDGTLVFTFWCSFCYSCRTVDKDLDQLAKQHRGQVGVFALDVSAGETTEKIAAFAAEKGLKLPIAISKRGRAADVFGVTKTTTTVIIDGEGVLRFRGQYMPAKDALQALLAGEPLEVTETKQIG